MTAPILEMNNIGKRYPGVIALDGVSLELYPGEVVAVIGENGAGKSTLMKSLGGVVQPDSGTISIDGKPVKITSVSDAITHRISFIHQELNVLDNLDIGANIYLGREPRLAGFLIDTPKIRQQSEVYLRRLGLTMPASTPLRQLSIAQRQLVEIAKALSLDARILIMDEPTSSLTLIETERLIEVVKELRNSGVGILYISHRLKEVVALADRVVGLRDGRPAGLLAKEEITHENMVRMMVGRDLKAYYPEAVPNDVTEGLKVTDLRTQRFPKKANSFEARRGEILGFAGLIGAGRSELAEALFGVTPAIAGSMTLDGKSISVQSSQSAIKNGIFLAPEDRRKTGVVVEMSITENITLAELGRFASVGLVNKPAEVKVAETMSKRLNVKAPNVQSLVVNLSGGNQQKVVLAKWLSLSPKVMIFDEPTRGIDVGAKAEIYDLMRQLAREGVAVIMISSDMEEVLGVSDRIAVMHEGTITGVLDRNDSSEEAIMHLAVGGH